MTDGGQGGAMRERLWRLRRRQHYVDAYIGPPDSDGRVVLAISFSGTPTWSHHSLSRADAVALALARRAELEREGWTFHW